MCEHVLNMASLTNFETLKVTSLNCLKTFDMNKIYNHIYLLAVLKKVHLEMTSVQQ